MRGEGYIVWNDSYPDGFSYPVDGDLPVGRYRKIFEGYENFLCDEVTHIEQETAPREELEEIRELLDTVHKFSDAYVGGNPMIDNALRAVSENYFQKILRGRISELGDEQSIDVMEADVLAAEGTRLAAEKAIEDDTFAFHNGGGHHHGYRGQSSDPTFNRVNDEAATIDYVKEQLNDPDILVIDLDFHFGDGTVSIFRDDPNVYHLSMHQWDVFPHKKSGWLKYTGSGPAKGTKVNVPLTSGVGGETYLSMLGEALPPLVEQADPDYVIYQSGVDSHHEDPLGEANLTNQDLFRRDRIVAEQVEETPLTVVVGGGYGPEAGCAEVNTLAALTGRDIIFKEDELDREEIREAEMAEEKMDKWFGQLKDSHEIFS